MRSPIVIVSPVYKTPSICILVNQKRFRSKQIMTVMRHKNIGSVQHSHLARDPVNGGYLRGGSHYGRVLFASVLALKSPEDAGSKTLRFPLV